MTLICLCREAFTRQDSKKPCLSIAEQKASAHKSHRGLRTDPRLDCCGLGNSLAPEGDLGRLEPRDSTKSQSYWEEVHRWPLSKGRRKTVGGARRACLLWGGYEACTWGECSAWCLR